MGSTQFFHNQSAIYIAATKIDSSISRSPEIFPNFRSKIKAVEMAKFDSRFSDKLLGKMDSSSFFVICSLYAGISVTCGSLIMFYLKEIWVFGHGVETARMILGSTPHDQLVIEISNSFAGLLLVLIGCLLFMVAFVKDREFQNFFAKGCVVLHLSMAVWRVLFERRVEDLAYDWPKQVVGDFVLSLSWVFFLVYTWRDKYD